MGIGLSGMISGMDTDSIVKALVSAQRTKATKIENKITLNKWTTDAWSSLNTKIYSFYTKYASKLRMQGTYMGRKATSSNEAIAKATASTSAAVGTHTLTVSQLASSQYVTGKQLSGKYNKNTKLTELNKEIAGTVITITGKKGTGSEKEVKLEIDENTTINDFLKACKDAGLTASFDEKQQRFFISSSASGVEDAFTIETEQLKAETRNLFKSIETKNSTTAGNTDNKLVDTSKLSASEKTSYEKAMETLRQNTDVLETVLADGYTPTTDEKGKKREKEVLDAVETVKNIAANQYAENKASKDAKQYVRDQIQNGSNGFTVYDKTYTKEDYEKFQKSAKENVEAGYRAEAKKAAVKDLTNYFQDTNNKAELDEVVAKGVYADPSKISYADILAAEGRREELEKKFADASLDWNTVRKSQSDLDNAVTEGKLDEKDVETLKLLNTWDLVEYGTNQKSSAKIEEETFDSKASNSAKDEEDLMFASVLEDKEIASKYTQDIADRKAAILKTETKEDGTVIEDPTVTTVKGEVESILKDAAEQGTGGKDGTLLHSLGLGAITDEIVKNGLAQGADASGMVVIAAADAEFELDGVSMTETSNNFTVNGLTLDLVSTSTETVQITVGKDAGATYDFIKEAITEYNKLIEEMNTLYNAKSARGYDPLTSEQKESMSESDIEAWEKKIKDSLLRRDETLGGLLTGMRTALSSTYTNADGKTFSLSTFGIVTGNYTEYGKLHIYGDEDDSTYAEYADRLKKALEDNPEEVMDALSNIFGNLYTTMQEKCAAKKDISSALTFYNDKSYSKALEGYEKDLTKMESKIKDLEDRYYKQFTAMETALAKLQSQTNSLAAMLGTGSNQ